MQKEIKRTLSSKAMAAVWDGKNHDDEVVGQPASLVSTESSEATTGDRSTVNASFTPGPWAIKSFNGAVFNLRKGEETLATIYANLGSPTLQDKVGEGTANARLIAAAPDMYAALKEIEWIFEGCEDITDNGGPNDAMRAMTAVRAALAKAEGR